MLSFKFPWRRSPKSLARARRIPLIEGLESRQLLSGSPVLTGIRILGPVAKAYGIVLSFDSSLDTASAQDTSNYIFGHLPAKSSNNGIDLGTILGFLATRTTPAVKDGKVQFLGGRYDDSNHTVTLTPVKAFNVWRFFRILRVKGTGTTPIINLDGIPLNGGAGTDTVLHWTPKRGKIIRYSDSDGDRVVIRVKGPGMLYAFFHKSGNPFPSIFVTQTKPGKSALIGTVQTSPTGDGIAHIAQLSGSIPANTNMFSNAQIDVQST
ncbi:MAG TPA: hypothetical protein VIM11_01300 [Tepidisphaeraceae bacterium]